MKGLLSLLIPSRAGGHVAPVSRISGVLPVCRIQPVMRVVNPTKAAKTAPAGSTFSEILDLVLKNSAPRNGPVI